MPYMIAVSLEMSDEPSKKSNFLHSFIAFAIYNVLKIFLFMPMFLFKNRYKIKYNIKKITYHFSIQERIEFFFCSKE